MFVLRDHGEGNDVLGSGETHEVRVDWSAEKVERVWGGSEVGEEAVEILGAQFAAWEETCDIDSAYDILC